MTGAALGHIPPRDLSSSGKSSIARARPCGLTWPVIWPSRRFVCLSWRLRPKTANVTPAVQTRAGKMCTFLDAGQTTAQLIRAPESARNAVAAGRQIFPCTPPCGVAGTSMGLPECKYPAWPGEGARYSQVQTYSFTQQLPARSRSALLPCEAKRGVGVRPRSPR